MPISVENWPRTYWTLDGLTFNRFDASDEQGNLLRVVESSSGWEGRPAPKSERGKRNLQHGSRAGAAHLDERIITWQGWSISYSDELITNEMLRLRALASDPWATYELMRWEPAVGAMVASVQIDDAFDITRQYRGNQHELIWSAQFVAPDPRQWEAGWRTFSAPLSGGMVGGVDASGLGADASGPGLAAGTWVPDNIIRVQNVGSADFGAIFELEGPWSNATIVEIETGNKLYINDVFEEDSILYINTDMDQQYGIPGRAALRDLSVSRRNRLVREGAWFNVPKGQVRSYLWRSDIFNAGARMNVRYRSAWR